MTPRRIVFHASFPTPPMRKNDHRQWWSRAAAEKPIITEATVRARAIRPAAIRFGWSWPTTTLLDVRLVWMVTDKRRRDASGPQPTLDAWVDGLRYGGLLADDHHGIVRRAWCEIEAADDPGVRIEVNRLDVP